MTETQRDLWTERLSGVKHTFDGRTYIKELVVERVTVLAREDQEAITIIPEKDTSYGFIRWVTRAGAFMFGLVAHECKVIGGKKYRDNHFSMYRGTDGAKGKVGFWDAEFWDRKDKSRNMISVQDTSVRMVDTALYLESESGKRFRVTVSDSGVMSAVPVAKGELHNDMEPV